MSLEVDDARVRVQPSRAEVVLLVPLVDGEDYVVSSVGRRWPNTENMSWDHDIGLEVQLVIGNAHRGVLAVQVIKTTDSFTPHVRHFSVVGRALEGQAAEAALDVVASLCS